ncbi:hypothetical protein A0256_24345 [Mucilaginibacter sp. PAMC 26640]|nr:hypothetical protein A0256_24345 [Mucilaginibacter sp. PAMC 26640]
MKILKPYLLTGLFFCLLFGACETVAYLRKRFPRHHDVSVYYAARDVKREYKVTGHFSNVLHGNEENSKTQIIDEAKTVGADAVIFTSFANIAGKDRSDTITADAIKYTDAPKTEEAKK